MICYRLADFPQSLLIDDLSNRRTIFPYAKIKLSFLMLVKNGSNGDHSFLKLSCRFLVFQRFSFHSQVHQLLPVCILDQFNTALLSRHLDSWQLMHSHLPCQSSQQVQLHPIQSGIQHDYQELSILSYCIIRSVP